MPFCLNCGVEVSYIAKFCFSCGNPISNTKPQIEILPNKISSVNTKQISVAEYASKIDPKDFRENRKNPSAKITQQAIKYRIMNKMHLPEVLNYNKVGKVHVLTVKADF